MYIRNTVQRQAIKLAVSKLKNHPTAEEVYIEVVKDYPYISKATVYRGLNELVEAKELRLIDSVSGAKRYDHTLANHYHARCTKCGKVFDMPKMELPDLTDKVKGYDGFKITGQDVIFSGICKDCQKK